MFDGKTLLKRFCACHDVTVWTEFCWLTIGSEIGRFVTRRIYGLSDAIKVENFLISFFNYQVFKYGTMTCS